MIKGHIKFCICPECDEDGKMAALYETVNKHTSLKNCYCKRCDPAKIKFESDRTKLFTRMSKSC